MGGQDHGDPAGQGALGRTEGARAVGRARTRRQPARFRGRGHPAGPPTLVVDAQGEGNYKTINEALAAAPEGATIMVRPGEYHEGVVLDKKVSIIGDGPRDEIVVISRDANCIRMATEEAGVANLSLRGRAGDAGKNFFAMDAPLGRLRMENCDITSDSLACVAVHGADSNPTLIGCRIHDGQKSGIFVFEQGQGAFEGCDIFGNAIAGVMVKEGGNPALRDCRIHDGKQGGIFVFEQGQGVFEGCDIFGNAIAGVEVREGGSPTLRQCRIHDGKQGGIYVNVRGKGIFEGCDITGNAGAGVLVQEGGNPTVSGCRIERNGYQGILVRKDGAGTFTDNLLVGNALGAWKIASGARVKRSGNRARD